MPPDMESAAVLNFADQLRSAREAAIGDGEAFGVVIPAIERLGSFLNSAIGDLGRYEEKPADLCPEEDDSAFITPFSLLFLLVKDARNDALHQGAFARHLTAHAIELALRLEEALRNRSPAIVKNYMVRNPTCAEFWQPIGLIRQQMLANSFSFMPVKAEDGEWRVLSNANLAVYLRENPEERNKRTLVLN